MSHSEADSPALTPEQSWRAIHDTMEQARSALHVAGATRILLLWGAIASLGYLSEYLLTTAGAALADGAPWIRAPLWGLLVVAGMAGSAVIGHRAGREIAEGAGTRAAGLRVFFFWLACGPPTAPPRPPASRSASSRSATSSSASSTAR